MRQRAPQGANPLFSTRSVSRATPWPTVITDFDIQANRHVTLDYELRDEDGDLLDASESEGGEPIRYVHGYGMLVPGLEAALVGLHVGDERDILVPADSGYGEYDESLLVEIDRDEFPNPKAVEIDDEFVAEAPDGEEVAMRVVELKDDSIVVDANHPLAGMTLRYHVTVRSVRLATDAEIERAASELDDAHEHMHGPDCDHTHEPATLAKRAVN